MCLWVNVKFKVCLCGSKVNIKWLNIPLSLCDLFFVMYNKNDEIYPILIYAYMPLSPTTSHHEEENVYFSLWALAWVYESLESIRHITIASKQDHEHLKTQIQLRNASQQRQKHSQKNIYLLKKRPRHAVPANRFDGKIKYFPIG